MLGTTRLHTVFGAARRGYNTSGLNSMKSLVNAYSREGLSVMFISPRGKTPADYRTPGQIKKQQKDWTDAGNEGEPLGGFYLATDQKATLGAYLKEARKQHDGADVSADARHGLTPLNLGLVPNRSRVAVIDCDTTLEVDAFRNWYMDHTHDLQLRKNLDVTLPSVTTPGSIKGGQWEVAQGAYTYQDYGEEVYVPPAYVNHGGNVDHAGGGHWYFFYPEGYELPDNTRTTIDVHYDAESRTPLLTELRAAEDAVAYAHDQESYDAALERVAAAEKALDDRREWAQKTYAAGGFNPKLPSQVSADDPISSNFVVMLKNCYVIIPPSSRFEGHYEVVSGDFQWEDWLTDLIAGNAQKHASPLHHPSATSPPAPTYDNGPGLVDGFAAITSYPAGSLNEIIEPWAQLTSWESILTPEDGWIRQVNDRCGCPIFTAPGKHASPKSVTAHDGGCTLAGGCSELGRLHFWTSNPPPEFFPHMLDGKRDFSKMSALAITQFEGNQRRAIESAGLSIPALRDVGNVDDKDFNDFLLEQLDAAIAPDGDDFAQEPLTLDPFDTVINEPPPVYIVSDTFESDSFNAMIGPSGSGKSFVAIDLAAALVTGGAWMGKRCRQMKVAYFAGEGRRGVVDRFRSWQTVRNDETLLMNNKMFFANYLPNLSMYSTEDYQKLSDKIIEIGAEFVIIDTWSRANAGADENAAETTSKTIDTLNGMQRQVMNKLGRCTILVIHHTRKDSDSARGSSAFNAALDTELLIKAAEDPDGELGRRLIQVEVSKQKNSEPWSDPLYCQIRKVGEDKLTLDADGFPNTVKAPAAIADLDGHFPSPADIPSGSIIADTFGFKYTLDEPVRTSSRVDQKTMYLLIEEVVTKLKTATRSQITSAVFNELLSDADDFFLPPTVKTEIMGAIISCADHGMLQPVGPSGSKYQISKTRFKKNALEVYDLVMEQEEGESGKASDSTKAKEDSEAGGADNPQKEG